MSVDELQAAITHLSAEEFDHLSRWLDEYRADLWDRRIEADILDGRLEAAGRRADEDFEAGRCTRCRESFRLARVLGAQKGSEAVIDIGS